MKRSTSVVLGAFVWSAVLGVMVAGVLFARQAGNDVTHAMHPVRQLPTPLTAQRADPAVEAPVGPPCAVAKGSAPTVEKGC